jgi:hypothetical protein
VRVAARLLGLGFLRGHFCDQYAINLKDLWRFFEDLGDLNLDNPVEKDP